MAKVTIGHHLFDGDGVETGRVDVQNFTIRHHGLLIQKARKLKLNGQHSIFAYQERQFKLAK